MHYYIVIKYYLLNFYIYKHYKQLMHYYMQINFNLLIYILKRIIIALLNAILNYYALFDYYACKYTHNN